VVEISVDELETIRLNNIEDFDQKKSAKKMKIHQSTFQRTLTRAMKKISDALVNGKAIKIKGGEYVMPGKDGTGPVGMGRGIRRGFGARGGRMGGSFAAGVGGMCKCLKCGHTQKHIRAQPCNKIKCPKCKTLLVREQ